MNTYDVQNVSSLTQTNAIVVYMNDVHKLHEANRMKELCDAILRACKLPVLFVDDSAAIQFCND